MEEVGKRRLTFGILVLFTITFIIMLSGFSSAAHMCADGQVILRLSDTTNAHGEVWNGAGNYGTEICYDDIFPGKTGSGVRTCDGDNKIVGLSGSTNAHGEDPSLSNYATNVCYKDLDCNLRSSCETEETEVLSLSSSTNAHLATAGGYSNKICCTIVVPPTGGTCGDGIIQSPNGETPPINEQCDGGTSCIAPGETNKCQCPIGYVTDGDLGCEIESVSCEITSAYWSLSEDVLEGTSVDMTITGSNCNGESVNFLIAEADCVIVTCDYGDIDLEDTGELSVSSVGGSFSGTQAVVSWTTEWVKDDNNGLGDDDPEYVFKAELSDDSDVNIDDSGELKVILAPIDYCPDKPVVTCGDYYTLEDTTAETACNANICPGVAVYSIEITGGSCGEGMRCFCEWDTSDGDCKAESSEINGDPTEGYCKYYTTTEGSCEGGGFLIAEWTATWEGDENDESESCVDGSRTIECPAQIQLSFFNLYNMLITLLAIAGIYGILSLKKKD